MVLNYLLVFLRDLCFFGFMTNKTRFVLEVY